MKVLRKCSQLTHIDDNDAKIDENNWIRKRSTK